ncbi:ATP-binding cassette domain-containing protein [Companilactobacillus sp. HBUAS59544]|uniref:ATP-binding cassette domain-containing protein n=1 Tax=Companilactobacillus sp. HBUAS59544 TaxID=3109363 RepID=UPI002FF3BAD6
MIQAQQLSKSFGDQLVFSNLNFEISDGEFVSLIGPNGSGKTTLVKIMMGLEKPTSGNLQMSHHAIGYVPQFRNIDNDYPLSIEQFIRLNNKFTLNFSKRQEQNQKIQTILQKTGLTALKDRPLGLASGGEKQKAYLAQALLNDPKVLILDESTASLDVEVKLQLMDLVADLNQREHLTVIFITHDYDLTKKYTKKALLFENKTLKEINVTDVSKNMFNMEA